MVFQEQLSYLHIPKSIFVCIFPYFVSILPAIIQPDWAPLSLSSCVSFRVSISAIATVLLDFKKPLRLFVDRQLLSTKD